MEATKTAPSSDGTGEAPSIELLPGDVIAERYVVEEVLGRGGMGVVVAARHEALGHRVAIKLLAKGKLADAEAFERFTREAKIVAALESPHVVAVRDFGMHRGLPFMVMDLLAGRDLRRELELSGKLPLADAVDHVIGACCGLAAAHAKGIVHRDVKPANLFLATDRNGDRILKVVDFGVAKLAPAEGEIDLTRTDTAVGSPSYMSPEQIRDARRADPRADVWSLGVTLYKLLSDQLPFAATSSSGMYAAIIADPPIPLRAHVDVPVELEAIVLRCLEKSPAARYPGVGALAHALAPFASARGRALAQALDAPDDDALPEALDVPIEVAAVVAPVAPSPPPKRSRVPLALGTVVVVALVTVGGLFAFRALADTARTAAPSTDPAPVLTASAPAASVAASAIASAAPPAPIASARVAVEPTVTATAHPRGGPRTVVPPPVHTSTSAGAATATTVTNAPGFGGSALDGHR